MPSPIRRRDQALTSPGPYWIGEGFLKRRLATAVFFIFAFAIELSRDARDPTLGSQKGWGGRRGLNSQSPASQAGGFTIRPRSPYSCLHQGSLTSEPKTGQGPRRFARGPGGFLDLFRIFIRLVVHQGGAYPRGSGCAGRQNGRSRFPVSLLLARFSYP